jgi:hypothetical protein
MIDMTTVGGWLYSKHKITKAKWHEMFSFSIPRAARKKLMSVLEHTVMADTSELWTPDEVHEAAKQLLQRGRIDKKGLDEPEDNEELDVIAEYIRNSRCKKSSKKHSHKRCKGCKYDYDLDSDELDNDSDADLEDEITLWKAKQKPAVHFMNSAKEKTCGQEKLRKDRVKHYFSPESSAECE